MMLISVIMVIVLLFVDIQRCRRGEELLSSDDACEPVSIILIHNVDDHNNTA